MLAIILVALLTVSAVSAADNATQNIVGANETTEEVLCVQENSDENIMGASSGTFTDLANEIAKAGNTLNLNRDYCYNDKTDSKYENGIDIAKGITINGNGHTIDINNKKVALNIKSANVVLNNIKFMNCYSQDTGAVLADYSSKITNCRVIDCSFVNCHCEVFSGAIYWGGPDFILSGCNFIDCSGGTYGGAVCIANNKGSLIDCSFVNCHALPPYDGFNSFGWGKGGAINIYGDNIVMSGCSFTDCSSNDGGAVYLSGNKNTLSDCSFVNCHALHQDGNNEYSHGGAICFDEGEDNVISGCSFKDCSANDGGAICGYISRAIRESVGSGAVSDCSFVNCQALGYDYSYYGHGGAINWCGKNTPLSDCSFENCSADEGGAVYWQGGYDSYFNDYGNSEYLEFGVNGDLSTCSFVNCSAIESGGAVFWYGNDGSIAESDFIDCSSYNGGAVYWEGGYYSAYLYGEDPRYYEMGANGDLSTCSFVNCSAMGSGGAVFWYGNDGSIAESDFSGCSAADGGAVYWKGGHEMGANGVLSDCTFVNCYTFGSSEDYGKHECGGAVYWSGTDGRISESDFIDCSAADGGAVYWQGDYYVAYLSGDDSLYLEMGVNGAVSSCRFVNCSASCIYDEYEGFKGGCGGAVFWSGDDGSIVGSDFSGCSAGFDGGAVYWKGFYVESYEDDDSVSINWHGVNGRLSDCSFENCFASGRFNDYGEYEGGCGGAVYWSGDDGSIVGSDFSGCSAGFDGGAVFWSGIDGSIVGSDFSGCSAAADGGAVYWKYYCEEIYLYDEISVWHGANGALSGCSFKDCSALGYFIEEESGCGGALYLNSNKGSVAKSDFKNCKAAVNGGGIYFAGTDCTLINSTFEGNAAQEGSDWYNETPINIINMTKISTVISIPDLNICYGVTNILRIILKDADDNLIVGEKIRLLFNNEEHIIKPNSEGDLLYLIPTNLVPKTYIATARYDGNTKYESSSATGRITVRKMNFNISAVYNKEAKEIVFTFTNEYGGKYTNAPIDVTIGSVKNTYKTASGGQFVVSTADLDDGRYTVTAIFKGNSLYNPANITFDIVVGKYDVDISAVYNVASKELVATLTNDFTGKAISNVNVKFDIDGVATTVKSDSEGKAIFSTENMTSDKVTATVSYAGNSKYNPASTSITFSTKADIIISAVYNRANKEIVATLTNNATGKAVSNVNVKVTINGATSTVKSNGKGQVIVSTADYQSGTAKFSYAGNSKYNSASKSITFGTKDEMIISAEYNAVDREIVATLTSGATGKAVANVNVNVNINGVDYALKTNNKGQAKVSTADLPLGTYDATISYAGNSKYDSASISISFDVKTKVIVTDVYAYSDRIVAKLTNGATGKTIANANMIVEINGVKYNVKSDNKGLLTFDTTGLNLPSSYDLTISYRGNDRYTASSATVAVDLDKANMMITTNYHADKQKMVATLKNSKTGKVVSNANMIIDLNGVKTTYKSNDQGKITLPTADFAPGTYVGTVTYPGNARYNSISAVFKVDI